MSEAEQDLTCEEFLKLAKIEPNKSIRGAELQKLFWKMRGAEKEIERQKAFWASTNETLEGVYRQLETSTNQLWEKNKKIQSILENIKQGICTIDENLQIQPEYSIFLETLLKPLLGETPPAGALLDDALLKHSSLDEDKRSQLVDSLQNILGYDSLAFELNGEWLPPEMELQLQEKRHWETDWIPIENKDGIIEKMMICIRDVTELRKARSEAEAQRAELEMVGQLLRIQPQVWDKFSGGSRRQLDACRQLLTNKLNAESQQQDLAPIVADLFLNLHTIKGNSRTYGLSFLTQAVHIAEQLYSDYRHNPDKVKWTFEGLIADLDKIQQRLDTYDHIVQERLRNYGAPAGSLSDKGIEAFSAKLEEVLQSGLSTQDQTRSLYSNFANQFFSSFSTLLKPIIDSVPSMARQLNKPVPEFIIKGENVKIHPKHSVVLEGVLNHIVRNSMDHGLQGNKTGLVRIELLELPAGGQMAWRLECSDSGLGLNIPKLRQKLKEVSGSESSHTDIEAAEVIFQSGVSTAEQVTEISGRGVGMDAVRKLIRGIGGEVSIELSSDPPSDSGHRKFKLQLEFPEGIFISNAGDISQK